MRILLSFWLSFAAVNFNAAETRAAELADYPIRPVPAHHVRFSDAFWLPRLEINRTVTIPFSFQMCEETGRVENFKVAAGMSDMKWTGRFGFNDSDLSKIIEGASYSLMTHPDAALESYVDKLIGYMAAAQEDDGYLYTAWTARDKIDNPANIICCYPKENQWLESEMSHELYNLGHMYESVAAHHEATGKSNFLDVATKSAELLFKTFGPGKLEIPPGHPEVELGLVKLYRSTGDQRYLDLAEFFLDIRGTPTDDRPKPWGPYSQDHKPIREQDEAVGHAVRAIYLYAAATDVAAITGDRPLADAVDRLWQNVVGKKLYITGGIGATGHGEAFGRNYDLPNRTAYCETCAGIALCYWAHRMFLLHGDAEYIDVLERALYNNVLDGISMDGKQFFYPNPLASRGDYERSKWFDCSCCPSNLCRFIPSVPGYTYAVTDDAIYVNLFVAGSAELELANGNVQLEQATRYPWDGFVDVKVTPTTPGQKFALHVRIPGWATGEPVPSDLYRFSEAASQKPRLAVNGEAIEARSETGFVKIDRTWQPGDVVTLELPMPVRRVLANENVAADRGRAALERGPIVYCIEETDVAGGEMRNLVLGDDVELSTEFRPDLLGGVQVVTGTADEVDGEQSSEVAFAAVPYYSWAHRGKGRMAVWLPRTPDAIRAREREPDSD